ncbi:MAG: hypothetical protein QM759_09310 [Terricaulis sp.]
MLRKLSVLAFVPLAAATLMAAATQNGHASMEFPPGFSATHPPNEKGILTASENGTDHGPNCNLQSKDAPGLATLTAAQIDADISHTFTPEEWANLLGWDVSTLTILKTDYKMVDNRPFHTVTLTVPDRHVTLTQGIYLMPGYVVVGGCYALADLYDTYADRFDATISTLRVVE